MSTSAVYDNGFQLTMEGSNSRIPIGKNQIQMKPSKDQVIFIANFNRELMNFVKIGFVFHQALLVITQSRDCKVKYHIVEYEDDSQAKGYQIKIKIKNNINGLNNITKFDDGQYIWEKMSIKKQFDIDTLDIKVDEIMERMQNIANLKGPYATFSNNCQTVANALTEQLLQESISNQNVIFLSLVEKQKGNYQEGESLPHSALLVATNHFHNGSSLQNQKYYIVEYLNNDQVSFYQFYFNDYPQNWRNLQQFDDGQSYWEAKEKICQFYLKQTVQNIIDIMKENIRFFFNSSQSVAQETFKKINTIQEDERKRLEWERERLERERRMNEQFDGIKTAIIFSLACYAIYKILF